MTPRRPNAGRTAVPSPRRGFSVALPISVTVQDVASPAASAATTVPPPPPWPPAAYGFITARPMIFLSFRSSRAAPASSSAYLLEMTGLITPLLTRASSSTMSS